MITNISFQELKEKLANARGLVGITDAGFGIVGSKPCVYEITAKASGENRLVDAICELRTLIDDMMLDKAVIVVVYPASEPLKMDELTPLSDLLTQYMGLAVKWGVYESRGDKMLIECVTENYEDMTV